MDKVTRKVLSCIYRPSQLLKAATHFQVMWSNSKTSQHCQAKQPLLLYAPRVCTCHKILLSAITITRLRAQAKWESRVGHKWITGMCLQRDKHRTDSSTGHRTCGVTGAHQGFMAPPAILFDTSAAASTVWTSSPIDQNWPVRGGCCWGAVKANHMAPTLLISYQSLLCTATHFQQHILLILQFLDTISWVGYTSYLIESLLLLNNLVQSIVVGGHTSIVLVLETDNHGVADAALQKQWVLREGACIQLQQLQLWEQVITWSTDTTLPVWLYQ